MERNLPEPESWRLPESGIDPATDKVEYRYVDGKSEDPQQIADSRDNFLNLEWEYRRNHDPGQQRQTNEHCTHVSAARKELQRSQNDDDHIGARQPYTAFRDLPPDRTGLRLKTGIQSQSAPAPGNIDEVQFGGCGTSVADLGAGRVGRRAHLADPRIGWHLFAPVWKISSRPF
ncbi:MAG: hypothetical protein ABI648_01800 [Betaproteobacteria bacterium]